MLRWLVDSPRNPGWPAELGPVRVGAGVVTVRPVRMRDASDWSRLRIKNQNDLLPWEPTGQGPWAARHQPSSWGPMFSLLKSEAKRGSVLPFVIEVDGRYAGQLTIGNVQRGAVRSAWIGYWVDADVAGRGVASAAVALGVDHAFGAVGLHRLEATVQPDNGASQAVLGKVGFRQEGLLKRYMDVNARWRDHLLFALTNDEVSGSAVDTLIRSGRAFAV
ncbi:GNAT family N-acetyltransferase [Gordonia hydrophobica]|uniref:GNAT family protein n=1 Tax=Gordonia hydrophobica TaxID=40516 RepID=A0ABZ2U3A9_9ACTN|nr:GNAT family protein [Gordonia hydrophobica]MBM7367345.1 ribosomal-protein-alanine N-acetyltransferase [Gordonia hydrophobica]